MSNEETPTPGAARIYGKRVVIYAALIGLIIFSGYTLANWIMAPAAQPRI